jgi:hypothetical protein
VLRVRALAFEDFEEIPPTFLQSVKGRVSNAA